MKDTHLQGIITYLLLYLYISKAQKRVPPFSPKAGPLRKKTPFPEPYLIYPSWSPVKEPSLQVPLVSPLGEKCTVSSSLFHSSFRVPGTRATPPDSKFFSDVKVPLWRDMPVFGTFFNIPSMVQVTFPSLNNLRSGHFRREILHS
jgi:hypothetical protein